MVGGGFHPKGVFFSPTGLVPESPWGFFSPSLGFSSFLVSFLFSTTSRMSSPKQSWECAYGWLLLFLSLFSPSNNGYPQFYTCRYLCCQLCVCPSE